MTASKYNPIKVFALISGLLLFFTMIGLVIFRDTVFASNNPFELPILFFGLSIILIVIFDFYSIYCMIKRLISNKRIKYYALPFAGICIILLFADKVMIDEIGKEYGTIIDTLGEWMMLYTFWGIQLFYNFLMFKMTKKKKRMKKKKT